MLHNEDHEISYEYDGNFELLNISKIFLQVNEDNSIGNISNKIINLILCTLSHCTLYYTHMLIFSDKTKNIYQSPYSLPMVQRTSACKTQRSGPNHHFHSYLSTTLYVKFYF